LAWLGLELLLCVGGLSLPLFLTNALYFCVLCDSHNNTTYFYKQLTSFFIYIEKNIVLCGVRDKF